MTYPRAIARALGLLLWSRAAWQAHAEPKCYMLDGSPASDKVAPCDGNATGEALSHTSCCNAYNKDACE